VEKDKRRNLVTEKLEAHPSRGRGSGRASLENAVPIGEVISRFQERRKKIGTVKAALEAELTVEEVCSILEGEKQEAMRMAAEAWDKLHQVRLALVAMRGNLNSRALEETIEDIGVVVDPPSGVNSFIDE